MKLRKAFESQADGLSLEQFVRLLLKLARSKLRSELLLETGIGSKSETPSLVSDESDVDDSDEPTEGEGLLVKPLLSKDGRPNLGAVNDLCEFFDRIDVNRDGKVGWEDFTHFIIHHGMRRTDIPVSQVQNQYLRRNMECKSIGVRKPGESGPGPLRIMRWSLELQHLFVGAAGSWAQYDVFQRTKNLNEPLSYSYSYNLKPLSESQLIVRDISPTARRQHSDASNWLPSYDPKRPRPLPAGQAVTASLACSNQTAKATHHPESHEPQASHSMRVEVIDIAFAPIDELIIILASDTTLRYFHVASRTSISDDTIRPMGATRLEPLGFTRLGWWAGAVLEGRHRGSRLIFLAGPKPAVTVFASRPFDGRRESRLSRDGGSPPTVAHYTHLKGHTSLVTDLLILVQPKEASTRFRNAELGDPLGDEDENVLPRETGLLATASLDRSIRLWALPKCESCCKLIGHGGGVRSLSYDPEQRLLISAGFDFGLRAWGITGDQGYLAFSMEGGHFAPIRTVASAPGAAKTAISLDDTGRLCWWDISRDSACPGHERLLQTFSLHSDVCTLVAPCGFGLDWAAVKKRQSGSRVKCQSCDQSLQACSSSVDRDIQLAAAALDWSTNAVTLVCGSKQGKLHLYDASEARLPEARPSLLAYSHLTHEIVSIHGTSMKVWDARSGTLRQEHALVSPKGAEITGFAFDARGLRFYLADRYGSINLHHVHDGSVLSAWTPHQAEIGALVYSPLDRLVITCGWDRAIHIYDELQTQSTDALLRQVKNAHEADILCMALGRDLGLLATAAGDGVIRLWDFEDLQLRGSISQDDGRPLPLSCAIAFVEKHPIVVIADVNADLWLAAIEFGSRTLFRDCYLVTRFPNHIPISLISSVGTHRHPCPQSVARSLDVSVESDDSLARSHVKIYTGDASGQVHVFDILPLLANLEICPIPDDELRWRDKGFNARRRMVRDHALSAFGRDLSPVHNLRTSGSNTTFQRFKALEHAASSNWIHGTKWRAHNDSVTCVLLTSNPRRLLTASADGTIKCWNTNGESRGVLSLGRDADARALRNFAVSAQANPMPVSLWNFLDDAEFDSSSMRGKARAQAVLHRIVSTIRIERENAAAAYELARAKEATSRAVQFSPVEERERDANSHLNHSCKDREDKRLTVFRQLRSEMLRKVTSVDVAKETLRKTVNSSQKLARRRKKNKYRGTLFTGDPDSPFGCSTIRRAGKFPNAFAAGVERKTLSFDMHGVMSKQSLGVPKMPVGCSRDRGNSMYQNLCKELAAKRIDSQGNLGAVKEPAHACADLLKLLAPSDLLKHNRCAASFRNRHRGKN